MEGGRAFGPYHAGRLGACPTTIILCRCPCVMFLALGWARFVRLGPGVMAALVLGRRLDGAWPRHRRDRRGPLR